MCVSEEEANDGGIGFTDGEERRKKRRKRAKLEITKIMYRANTTTMSSFQCTKKKKKLAHIFYFYKCRWLI